MAKSFSPSMGVLSRQLSSAKKGAASHFRSISFQPTLFQEVVVDPKLAEFCKYAPRLARDLNAAAGLALQASAEVALEGLRSQFAAGLYPKGSSLTTRLIQARSGMVDRKLRGGDMSGIPGVGYPVPPSSMSESTPLFRTGTLARSFAIMKARSGSTAYAPGTIIIGIPPNLKHPNSKLTVAEIAAINHNGAFITVNDDVERFMLAMFIQRKDIPYPVGNTKTIMIPARNLWLPAEKLFRERSSPAKRSGLVSIVENSFLKSILNSPLGKHYHEVRFAPGLTTKSLYYAAQALDDFDPSFFRDLTHGKISEVSRMMQNEESMDDE